MHLDQNWLLNVLSVLTWNPCYLELYNWCLRKPGRFTEDSQTKRHLILSECQNLDDGLLALVYPMFLFCFCSGDWFHKRSFCLQTGLCAWSRAAVKMPLASLGLPVCDVSQSKCQAHSQPFDPMMSYDLLCFFSFFL